MRRDRRTAHESAQELGVSLARLVGTRIPRLDLRVSEFAPDRMLADRCQRLSVDAARREASARAVERRWLKGDPAMPARRPRPEGSNPMVRYGSGIVGARVKRLRKGQRPVEGYSGGVSPGPAEPRSSHEGSIAAGPGHVFGNTLVELGEGLRVQGYATSSGVRPDDPEPGLHLRIEWPPHGPVVVLHGHATLPDRSAFTGSMDCDLGLLLRLFAGDAGKGFRDVLHELYKDALREQHRMAALHQQAADEARDRVYELTLAWGEAHTLG